MSNGIFDSDEEIHWCPGCGNYGALKVMKEAFEEVDLTPQTMVVVSGIGQAAKQPHFMHVNMINGLHGRYLSYATAIKACNPNLAVVAISGDGCTYSEGGNHFLHTIRYNPNLVNIVHNNQVFGLTKGQASPTSQLGYVTDVQVHGVFHEPFNGPAIAIALGASFVARAFIGDQEQTKEIYKKALTHKGYALIDLFCPCVTFNRVNTYQWFKEHTYYIDETHDPYDREKAFKLATETDPIPLGVYYLNPNKPTYEENLRIYANDSTPLFQRELNKEKLAELIESFR